MKSQDSAILKQRYQSFIEEEKGFDFFVGLAEYVQFIEDRPSLKRISESAMTQRAEDIKKVEEYEAEAIKEIKVAKQKLWQRLQTSGISEPWLDKQIKEYGAAENVSMLDGWLSENLYHRLVSIIRELYNFNEGKYRDVVADMVNNGPVSLIFPEQYTFTKALLHRAEADKVLEDRRDTAMWYAWEKLKLAHLVFHSSRERLAQLREQDDLRDFGKLWYRGSYLKLLEEREVLKNGNSAEVAIFKIENFKPYAKRVHHYLLAELTARSDDEEIDKDWRVKIIISSNDGIYRVAGDQEFKYPIQRKSKRFQLIQELHSGNKDGPELVNKLRQKLPAISQTINKINKLFRTKLLTEYDLITTVSTGGYQLNTKKYDLEFSE